jgi:Zn-dependent protease
MSMSHVNVARSERADDRLPGSQELHAPGQPRSDVAAESQADGPDIRLGLLSQLWISVLWILHNGSRRMLRRAARAEDDRKRVRWSQRTTALDDRIDAILERHDPSSARYQPPSAARTAAGVMWSKVAVVGGWIVFVLTKLKFFTTAGTMLLSIGAYTLIWGPKFAVGFVLLLLAHEYGHVWQMRREGFRPSAPMFIPFLGAMVIMRDLPKNAAAEARIGLAGPVVGTVACLIPLGVWVATGSELFMALAFVGFLLNLFNLVPVTPLDGGRAAAALSPWLWLPGCALMAAAAILLKSPLAMLVLLVGGISVFSRFRARRQPDERAYYESVTLRQRLAIAGVWGGLTVGLLAGMAATYIPHHQLRSDPVQVSAHPGANVEFAVELPDTETAGRCWMRAPGGARSTVALRHGQAAAFEMTISRTVADGTYTVTTQCDGSSPLTTQIAVSGATGATPTLLAGPIRSRALR